MPFDGQQVETPAIRRAVLIDALRHPMIEWEWNYGEVKNKCGTAGCAIGLASVLWPKVDLGLVPNGDGFYANVIAELPAFLGIFESEAQNIFNDYGSNFYGVPVE